MKKFTTLLLIILISTISLAQAQVKNNESIPNDNKLNNHTIGKYRLFPTQNIWIFIKLDTQNGRMWQVQYNMEENKRFESILNLITLVDKEKEVNDRFTLYSTQSTYAFILLDKIDGRTWQVQWSIELESRGIIPIGY